MEVFAGFTAQTDARWPGCSTRFRSQPDADNTPDRLPGRRQRLVGRRGLNGLLNENSFFNGVPETLADNLKHIE